MRHHRAVDIDLDHLERILPRYDRPGPRYTSYPTAPVWNDRFSADDFRKALGLPAPGEALSIYVHVPFCRSLCHFCACNRVITRRSDHPERYLDTIEREIATLGAAVGKDRPVSQLHWGGGTPTHLDPAQIIRLHAAAANSFDFAEDAEKSIEVDPRVTTKEHLEALRQCGFGRLSMGVQDFDGKVQEAIRRTQPVQQVASLTEDARSTGFKSVGFDLIYGLPLQTEKSFDRTLDSVIGIRPDRIALYSYAHVTWVAPQQRGFEDEDLPTGQTKLSIFQNAIRRLLAAGYEHIGMDHFALPTDSLTLALREGRLQRNFMGYAERAADDLIGTGPSAISGLRGTYAQSERKLGDWHDAVASKGLATMRGHQLDSEDQLRRWVIQEIMCRGHIDPEAFASRFEEGFDTHFSKEIERLDSFESDGLLVRGDDGGFTLTGIGRLLMRNVAMLFDAYLPDQQETDKPLFSKTV